MALSVVSRPQGYLKGTTEITATYVKDSSTITKTAHGLSTGNIIYIEQNEAIGFWYVTASTADAFTIREYATATVYTFVGTGSLSYYLCTAIATFASVHLPIVYKLQSTSWPTNSVDTVRTVSSYTNDNGYVKITASGTIKSDITELEFVKVTFTGGTTGIYQVLSWYSNSVVTINLAYAGGITFNSIQYYYNNYHARIRVYGGLAASHYFGSVKPYELLTEQKIIPDSNGLISFNINKFLKKQIGILKNDLLKGTLPNNLDAFCEFYIEYAEGYDYATGGYTLMDFVSSYTDDLGTFTGYAVNADMPFKSLYYGHLSEYVLNDEASKFLTPSLYPEITPGQYFDLSFLNTGLYSIQLFIERYIDGVLLNSSFETIPDYDYGVYRISVSQSANEEDQIGVSLVRPYSITDSATWSEPSALASGPGVFDSKAGNHLIKIGMVDSTDYSVSGPVAAPVGADPLTLSLTLTITNLSGVGPSLLLKIYQITSNTLIHSEFYYADGVYQIEINLPDLSSPLSGIDIIATTFSGSADVDIYVPVQVIYTAILSETKTITINTECQRNAINLSWLNYLGGFDYKTFTSNADFGVSIGEIKTIEKNIFTNWPKSFGEGADTIVHQTSRSSRNNITVRAENLSQDQINDLYRIRLSPLVQIVNSEGDRRTVLVDNGSFVYLQQGEKLFNLTFNVSLTDQNPSQSL